MSLVDEERAALNSLKAQKHELQPEPGQGQHQHHVGEGEAKPAGKVDDTAVIWEESVHSGEEGGTNSSFLSVRAVTSSFWTHVER